MTETNKHTSKDEPSSKMKKLYLNQKNVSIDFTIVSSDGKNFPVILAVLINTTEYFKVCMNGEQSKDKYLKTDIPSDILDKMLKYCYTEEMPTLFDNAIKNIKMARHLDMWLMHDIVKCIIDKIRKSITFDNVIYVFNYVFNDTLFDRVRERCIDLLRYVSEFKSQGFVCHDFVSGDNARNCCKHNFNKDNYYTKRCCGLRLKNKTWEGVYGYSKPENTFESINTGHKFHKYCCLHSDILPYNHGKQYIASEWTHVDVSKLSSEAQQYLLKRLI